MHRPDRPAQTLSHHLTPLGAIVRGVAAGAVGTAALDLLGYARFRRGGGDQGFLDWESSAGLADWEAAPAPAQVGRRIIEGLFQIKLEPPWARATNNTMHWLYGTSWGATYGVVSTSVLRRRGLIAAVFGPAVWASGYVVLPLARLYKPIWRYDLKTLWTDLSGHLAYGLSTAAVFQALAGGALAGGAARHGVPTSAPDPSE